MILCPPAWIVSKFWYDAGAHDRTRTSVQTAENTRVLATGASVMVKTHRGRRRSELSRKTPGRRGRNRYRRGIWRRGRCGAGACTGRGPASCLAIGTPRTGPGSPRKSRKAGRTVRAATYLAMGRTNWSSRMVGLRCGREAIGSTLVSANVRNGSKADLEWVSRRSDWRPDPSQRALQSFYRIHAGGPLWGVFG